MIFTKGVYKTYPFLFCFTILKIREKNMPFYERKDNNAFSLTFSFR